MTVRLFGMSFASGSAPQIMAALASAGKARPRLVVTANMDHIISLSENPAFRKAYDGAAARTLDGMPLVWLARLRGQRAALRVTGHEILSAALDGLSLSDDRVFLVCASAAVGQAITDRLLGDGVPPAAIVVVVPPLGFEHDPSYGRWLATRVREHGTTLLVLGVGAPRSEIWCDRQGSALGSPTVLAIGDALNVAAGFGPRAPVLLQRLGLEWLFRFVHAPRRLFHRYFVRSWRFLWIVWRSRSIKGTIPLTVAYRDPEKAHTKP